MHRAGKVGVELAIGQGGCLQLRADRQPSDDLLAELVAHKVEIIIALNATNDPMPSRAWLACVARLPCGNESLLCGWF